MVDILLVEDNEELGPLLAGFLKKDGYQVFLADTGEKALTFLETDSAKMVLLDLMLPGIDGFGVCSAVRKKKTVPILIMSAIVEKEDKIKGFELGADDYIEKPVDIDILRAKIRATMARTYEMKESNQILTVGDLTVDLEARRVTCEGTEIELSVKEYELLLLFMKNAGKTLDKDYLFNEIWGADSFSENQTLTVHIKRIRNKIEKDPKQPTHILTVWGVGYKFEKA